MKKFNATKMMALLMALCLITSTFVGSTLAKYTTQADAADTARVAKFGVTVTADVVEDAGFLAAYNADESVTDKDGATIAQTVIASDGEDVLAPGTKGDLIDTSISGKPEVAVNVTTVANLELAGWEAEGYYCPIVITVDDEDFYGLDYTSMTEFEAAVEAKLNKNVNVAPNTDLAESHSTSWAWAFEGTDGKQTDVKDTILGDADTAATIAFSIKTTVTQID